MELVGRMMDGSIPFGGGLEPSPSGPGVGDDDRVDLLETVPLFRGCSKRQLKSIAGICETYDVPAATVLTRVGAKSTASPRVRPSIALLIAPTSAVPGAGFEP